MLDPAYLLDSVVANWPIWFVTITLVVAAVIDGLQLKVPNWITFPMIVSGWVYCTTLGPYAGWEGLLYSLVGTAVGLLLLLPAYAIGGMGAGDVKLMAGIGAWVGVTVTVWSFAFTAVIGGLIALGMVFFKKRWDKHHGQFWHIWNEILTVKDPEKLAAIAKERKPTMMLLPYGIPIAIGTIAYFAWADMLLA
ncbi:Type IV leader peptidase family protein [Pseudobythopirellula maris]|uniref:Type IV leader peptidase family protein n=1 Tax=Pseudobythopirellula maris TaxID=2527991 RepID=A0A5C5ZU88_9BACT|nr:A24 family peptidase [Pseudobythopirellula maris]TWT90665.1 Type IV leader peptidase family protein [Pseudobythopirellula maris]